MERVAHSGVFRRFENAVRLYQVQESRVRRTWRVRRGGPRDSCCKSVVRGQLKLAELIMLCGVAGDCTILAPLLSSSRTRIKDVIYVRPLRPLCPLQFGPLRATGNRFVPRTEIPGHKPSRRTNRGAPRRVPATEPATNLFRGQNTAILPVHPAT